MNNYELAGIIVPLKKRNGQSVEQEIAHDRITHKPIWLGNDKRTGPSDELPA